MRRTWRALWWSLCLLGGAGFISADDNVDWAWRPLRWQFTVTAEIPGWDAAGEARVQAELARVVERVMGPAVGIPQVPADVPLDARFEIVLSTKRGDLQAEIACYQEHLDVPVRPVTITIGDERMLAEDLLHACRQMYRSLARVTAAEAGTATLSLQGGELAPPDPAVSLGAVDRFFLLKALLPAQRNSSARTLRVPWTILKVTSRDGAELTAEILSGVRQPLSSWLRGRNRLLAIEARPEFAASTIAVRTYGASSRDWVGGRVTRQRVNAPPEELPLELLANRHGQLRLEPRKEDVVQCEWLVFWSGTQRLARVPVIVGLEELVSLELPDDNVRLDVEEELSILQDHLVDTVAARQVMLVSMRKLAKAEDWDGVRQGFEDLKRLPQPQEFETRLIGIRASAIQQARNRKDRTTEARINRLCDDVLKVIQRYLAPERVKAFRDELDELERAASQ